jgi:hypothetical protein
MHRGEAPSAVARAAVALGTALLAFCALWFRRSWSSGMIEGGDT